LISKKAGKVLTTNINLSLEKFLQRRNFSTDDNCPAQPNQTGEAGAKQRKKAHRPTRDWTLDPQSSNACTSSQA